MSKPDELLVDIAAMVESEQSNQMSLTVVVQGTVITGRLAPERVWRQRVAEVLEQSERLGTFSALFSAAGPDTRPPQPKGPPTHLYFHVARILQGSIGLPETGGMYRVEIKDVGAWTVGDFSYSDH
ncbi:hypothetical protein ACWCO0_19560 [Streptomyces tubercidicus]|uniref:Uncharacterized protein n=1 Tax=Streptomyces tubercidicus TaxID=47759 RepID=A0A640V0Y7_9ACTN|nr:hypothetical protein [Streptomyces tubercidicus]WAU15942.1 hypothetical protein STRTU_006697 [Streptomyces tubercidicus]GFE41839.1 hypothetical protein Stube_65120 [Streptomyces tubercidicus]